MAWRASTIEIASAPTAGAERSRPSPHGPASQHVLGVDRQQRGDAAEQHGEQVERDRAEHDRMAADVAEAREQRLERDRLALARSRGMIVHAADQHARQHEHGGAGRRRPLAGPKRVEQSAERRPADDGGLLRGRRGRDRARQQRRRHDAGHQRVHGRRLERARRAADRNRMANIASRLSQPCAVPSGKRQRGQRLDHLAGAGDDAAVEEVGDLAGDDRARHAPERTAPGRPGRDRAARWSVRRSASRPPPPAS